MKAIAVVTANPLVGINTQLTAATPPNTTRRIPSNHPRQPRSIEVGGALPIRRVVFDLVNHEQRCGKAPK